MFDKRNQGIRVMHIESMIADKDELMEVAWRKAKLAPPEFQNMVSYYYVSRYFTSLFEARNHSIPIQVWNEYRNALDHFFRAITVSDDKKESEIPDYKFMEAHVLSATLDILKLFCHRELEYTQEELGSYSKKVWLSVNNGEAYFSIKDALNNALAEFDNAKVVGSDETSDIALDLYLTAAFKTMAVKNIALDLLPELHQASRSESNIIKKNISDKNFRIFGSIAAGLGAAAIASIFLNDIVIGGILATVVMGVFYSLIQRGSK